MARQLRPEQVAANNTGEPLLTEMEYFTWKEPVKCAECEDWINDYQYYYFEKRSVEKSQKVMQ